MKSDSYAMRIVRMLLPYLIYLGIGTLVYIIYGFIISADLLGKSNNVTNSMIDSYAREKLLKDSLLISGVIHGLCIPI
ncbi:MAG: hypothetical protein IKO30_01735, partial [Lachnospiraceae bacterium]|nr:hypothetical protein [Lachnospiraceae bacterium]